MQVLLQKSAGFALRRPARFSQWVPEQVRCEVQDVIQDLPAKASSKCHPLVMIVFAIGILTVAVPVMVVGDSVRIAIPVAFPEALSIVMRCHQRPPGTLYQ
jgi:hypothetical protein